MQLHGHSLIAGERVQKHNDGFKAVSPLDSNTMEPAFYEADTDDVNTALIRAGEAVSLFRAYSSDERAQFLEAIADEIESLGDNLVERAHRESGLPRGRIEGERTRTANQLRLFAREVREELWIDARIDLAQPDRQPLPRPDLRRMLIPIGPVIVFGASNFPLAFSVAGGDTASALAAGNPVIVKAHGAHPGTGEMVAEAINRAAQKCQMPAGVFSYLHGSGEEIGIALVRHPMTRAVGFTGSRTAGRALFDAAVARPDPIPVFAEMSSTNPVFLLPNALRERGESVAAGLAQSVTLGVGQFCTKPGLVFGVGDSAWNEFTRALSSSAASVAPATMLHPNIHRSFGQGRDQMVKLGGVETLARAQSTADARQTQGDVTIVQTDAANFARHPELAEEVFGPFAVLVAGESLAELEEIARGLEGQLTATIHGTPEDLAAAKSLIEILESKVGRLIFNGFPTGVEVCPAMHHGGPYPATTDVRFTSVGTAAIGRFARPVCYQDFPDDALPEPLRNANSRGIWRLVNNERTQNSIEG